MGKKIAIDDSPKNFQPGTLWRRIQAATASALDKGALLPISTEVEFIEDCGVRFLVRSVSSLANREGARRAAIDKAANPFLPFDPALYVGDASETHVCLLNKYSVFDHHLLIVTREFEHQQSPLTRSDFFALWRCMAEYNGLGFYNAGSVAGASQSHKHLQLVPLPLAPTKQDLPLEPLRRPALGGAKEPATALPFKHVTAPLTWDSTDGKSETADTLLTTYRDLLQRLQLDVDRKPAPAYNLLVTRSWMLVVPRRQERFGTISLNALAFAGAFLVRREEQLKTLLDQGPMSALQHVAGST